MSLNATTQSLAMALATTLAGFIISQDNAGILQITAQSAAWR